MVVGEDGRGQESQHININTYCKKYSFKTPAEDRETRQHRCLLWSRLTAIAIKATCSGYAAGASESIPADKLIQMFAARIRGLL